VWCGYCLLLFFRTAQVKCSQRALIDRETHGERSGSRTATSRLYNAVSTNGNRERHIHARRSETDCNRLCIRIDLTSASAPTSPIGLPDTQPQA
jgi:hypothetical protein